jgi:hypothetical protein
MANHAGASSPAKRAHDRRGFYIHLGVYVIVNAGLAILDVTRSPDHLWFFWPLAGWGLGILANAAAVFGWFEGMGKVLHLHKQPVRRRSH